MNIFLFSLSTGKNAKMHADKHVVKMLVEYAQLLCGAHYFTPGELSKTVSYKLTHKNHPCAVWVRESLDNWLYLYELALDLYTEYLHRFTKPSHKSGDVILGLEIPNLPKIGLTPFPQAMPDTYKNDNVVAAYRSYFNGEKQNLAKWTNREKPNWFKEAK